MHPIGRTGGCDGRVTARGMVVRKLNLFCLTSLAIKNQALFRTDRRHKRARFSNTMNTAMILLPFCVRRVNISTTEITRTILPPEDSILAAKLGSDNGDLLILSGCALMIHTTLVMRLGWAIKEKGIRA